MENIIHNQSHDICLNMIVKNEAHVIKDTLENLWKYINFSYYVISDTGSTDNTIEIINDFFKSKNVSGIIYSDVWKDFGSNRTIALKEAYKKTKYLLVFDADDKIVGDFKLPAVLDQDSYYLKFGDAVTYKRILLINNHLKWIFVGVLHEYLKCTDKDNTTLSLIDGKYFVDSGKSGDRSKDPDKYKKDAIILENAFYEAEKNNDNIKIRYSFYTAQSHRDSNNKEKSIEWYKKRADLKDWNQEVYYSYYMIGNLYVQLNEIEKAIYYWCLAIEADEERYEAHYEIISHFRKQGNYKTAYNYYKFIKKLDINFNDKLFVYFPIYDYLLLYELSIILCYNDKHSYGLEIYNKLFLIGTLPIVLALSILENLIFYIDHLYHNLKFNENYLNFVQKIYKVLNGISTSHISCINKTVNKMISLYDTYDIDLIKSKLKNKSTVKVFLSITSCKRLDLFIKTINSFLINCKDIHLIDYFFCVDDNSSKEDRTKMLTTFPFIKYIFKTDEQKGHLKSMNIIWNKLNEIKPKYWIHLEDDWCFIKPCNYVQKSIDFLNKYEDKNIHQILFNKNYGEIIDCYNLVGGEKMEDDFILHIKDEDIKYGMHCAYWSHYSFRPSMCNVSTILKLGNYDTDKTFFEGEYANKYFSNGYKSAFYNEICCLHTGKLTSEKSNVKHNAYSLNSIDQFDNKTTTIDDDYIKNKYKFYKKMDHFGNDIYFHNTLPLDILIEKCEKTDNCIGFNTLGYFKDHIDLDNLKEINYNSEIGGLYINIERYDAKYGVKDLVLIEDIPLDTPIDNVLDKSVEVLLDNSVETDQYNLLIKESDPIQFINNYLFVEYFDYSGSDINYSKFDTISEMMIHADSIEECVAFNTLGFFKSSVDLCNLDKNEYVNKKNNGIYIKLSKLNNNNSFIKINNLNTLDKEYKVNDISIDFNTMYSLVNDDENEYIAFNNFGFLKKTICFDNLLYTNSIYNNAIYINVIKYYKNISKKHIRVKVICDWSTSEDLCIQINKMSMGNLLWSSLQFTYEDHNIDYYLILNKPFDNTFFIPHKSIVLRTKPFIKHENEDTNFVSINNNFLHINVNNSSLNSFIWNTNLTYKDLKNEKIDKCKNNAYTIMSFNHIQMEEVAVRLLKSIEFKSNIIDIYSNNNKYSFKNITIYNETDFDKNNFKDYKYCIVIEDFIENNYIDKLWDCILNETLCFYIGSPNISKYIDPKAYVLFDYSNNENYYQIIKNAIDSNLWEERIEFIRNEKNKTLEQYNLFPTVEKIIRECN